MFEVKFLQIIYESFDCDLAQEFFAFLRFLEGVLHGLLEDVPLYVRQNMWFQHVPPHFFTCGPRSSEPTIWATVDRSGGPIACPARSPDLIPLGYNLCGHMKSLIYETPVASEKDLLAGLWLWRMLEDHGLVIVCTKTWYGGIVS